MTRSLLPPNSTPMERAQEYACSLDHIKCKFDTLSNPWTCPESVLPYLAWAFSVDFWDSDWPVETKRRVVANAWINHAYKGTVYGLETALANLDHDTFVKEWFEYDGNPAHFKIDVELTTKGLSAQERANILKVVNASKNVRSRLDTLTVHLKNKSHTPKVACALCSSQELTIRPYKIPKFDHRTGTPVFAMMVQSVHQLTIYPKGAA